MPYATVRCWCGKIVKINCNKIEWTETSRDELQMGNSVSYESTIENTCKCGNIPSVTFYCTQYPEGCMETNDTSTYKCTTIDIDCDICPDFSLK